jgi:hypothetical protein
MSAAVFAGCHALKARVFKASEFPCPDGGMLRNAEMPPTRSSNDEGKVVDALTGLSLFDRVPF